MKSQDVAIFRLHMFTFDTLSIDLSIQQNSSTACVSHSVEFSTFSWQQPVEKLLNQYINNK
jgi:hypothetical protein